MGDREPELEGHIEPWSERRSPIKLHPRKIMDGILARPDQFQNSVQAPRTARDFECGSRDEPERACAADIRPEEPFELRVVGNVEEDFRFRLWHLSAL